MDYEKKYKDALEWARKVMQGKVGFVLDEVLEKFPELKESEDMIMVKFIKNQLFNIKKTITENYELDAKLTKAIDWLEKQGSKESVTCPICGWEIEKQGEQKPIKEHNACEFCEDRYGCVNPCSMKLVEEEKFTYKVKPKFEIGDLITNGILIGKIDEIHEFGYHAYFGDHYADVPDAEYWHKWTIQDAKDGDVLEFGDHGRLVVGIVSYVNKTTCKVDVNCLLENNNFKVGNYYNLDTIKPHPATQGQRDLLFQKMKEEGYEWDAEKKELKKIEQNTAWSEEDVAMLDSAIAFVEHSAFTTIGKGKGGVVAWLNSLKERYTWKPSDEQIKVLEFVMEDIEKDSIRYGVLNSVLEQLKKLKG